MSVRHALLALLSEGPKYGLQLQHEFEARTGEVWPLNVGQVYTTLQRLERDGLVESDDGEGERRRRATGSPPTATDELAEWLRTPPEHVPPPRDELVIKVLVALQVPEVDIHEILQVAPPARRRGDAAVHPGEGRRPRRTTWRSRSSSTPSCSGSRRRALARCRRRPLKQLPSPPRLAAAAAPRAEPARTVGGLAMTSALELRHVSKVYGAGPTEVHALGDVDLTVERGELVAIMGPSGSGKSTLLTIAGSLEEPTSGEVLVDGVDLATVSRTDRARLRRRSIGYVFQDFNLLAGLTAAENVALPLELDGVRARRPPRDGPRRARGARRRRPRRSLPRRAVRRRAPARRDRARHRRRAPAAARRRADRRARLGERRGGHAPAARPPRSGASPASS